MTKQDHSEPPEEAHYISVKFEDNWGSIMQCDLDFDLIFTKSKPSRAAIGIYRLRKCENDILTAMDARLQTNIQTNKWNQLHTPSLWGEDNG